MSLDRSRIDYEVVTAQGTSQARTIIGIFDGTRRAGPVTPESRRKEMTLVERNRPGLILPEREEVDAQGQPTPIYEIGRLGKDKEVIDGVPLLFREVAATLAQPWTDERHCQSNPVAGVIYATATGAGAKLYARYYGFKDVTRELGIEPGPDGIRVIKLSVKEFVELAGAIRGVPRVLADP